MAVGTNYRSYEDWIGLDAYDRTGDKIGKIDNVFLDTDTGRPEWFAIKTGLFGMNSSLAPIVGSQVTNDGIRVDADKDTVKDAPHVGEGGELDANEEMRLYGHYHIDRDAGVDAYTSERRKGAGYDVDRRPDTDYQVENRGDDASVTRREEELNVDTHREATGKVRLRKYVTTEQETITVPVEKERIVVERDSADASSTSKGEIGEEVAEMTVHEDKVDARKEVIDKETVRAHKERTTDTEKVQADLRKEQVDVDGDVDVKDKKR